MQSRTVSPRKRTAAPAKDRTRESVARRARSNSSINNNNNNNNVNNNPIMLPKIITITIIELAASSEAMEASAKGESTRS